MKKYFLITLFLFLTTTNFSQEYERNIMIEVFTNSHCPLCPSAHNTIDSYLANSSNASRVRLMFYHMRYPYSDDELYQDNTQLTDERNQIYGPYSSTPQAFFDGEHQSNSYSQWESRIDDRLAVMSSVNISLSGSADGPDITINADVDMSSGLSDDLLIHFVVVEDVQYNGRNGINNHKNVVREMITTPAGESISFASNQTVSKSFAIVNYENLENLSFIVFVQDASSLEVHQTEEITYSELSTTDVNDDKFLSHEYKLEQNYPNPFNPTTSIEYQVSSIENVRLTVYNSLGQQVAILVNEQKSPGSYAVEFDASDLPSGVYVYTLMSGLFKQSRKMLLLK